MQLLRKLNAIKVIRKRYKNIQGGIEIFDHYLEQVVELTNAKDLRAISQSFDYDEQQIWPRVERQIILTPETALELGAPQTESLAFLLWTETLEDIKDGHITLIGPELKDANVTQVPFAKIILVHGQGFNETNAYERYQAMDVLKFKLNLDGYMLRSIPQENKEWSRVSHSALKSGFSLNILGNEIIREYKQLAYVDAVEIIFITSSKTDIQRFKPIGKKVAQITQAMKKIIDNLEYDCGTCDFGDVCKEVDGLKAMHQKAKQ
ncbi:hypothetical protein [Desulfosporosinus fructosivorans]|uniref:hypothetical protein n=1 Tax=Desulfosporosinus fructosivorans TaxID=2018669 RepID=UPI00130DAA1C|nr:hypothetical protein [Desulfosporosinus fructosivorans]